MDPNLRPTEARQGSKGRPVLIILLVALALIVIGYLLIGGIGTATSPDGDALETESTVSAPGAETGTDDVVVSPEPAPEQ